MVEKKMIGEEWKKKQKEKKKRYEPLEKRCHKALYGLRTESRTDSQRTLNETVGKYGWYTGKGHVGRWVPQNLGLVITMTVGFTVAFWLIISIYQS